MKKIKLIYTIWLTILIPYYCLGQGYELEEKSVTGIFEIQEKSKSELFSLINKWISVNYNSSKAVIEMNDRESGTIIVKGINEVVYKNITKPFYPKIEKHMPDYLTLKFNHLIEINVKDNKYRIIYRITDIASEDVGLNTVTFKCITLNGIVEEAITDYYRVSNQHLKRLIGKNAKEIDQSLIKMSFEEINKNLLADIKQTMILIEKSAKQKDDW